MKFLKYFVSKVKPLGYKICSINEDYSSFKCVKCYNDLMEITWRYKECTDCSTQFDKDSSAGENIARCGIAMLLYDSRPHYLPIWHGRNPDSINSISDIDDPTINTIAFINSIDSTSL